jgi:AbiV family abortive infection protein
MRKKLTFREVIEEIISLAGCFLVFHDDNETALHSVKVQDKFLDTFRDKEKAAGAFSVFTTSKKNSLELLDEARLLTDHGFYARAVALAIMSYEELGKSQIAADYYSGILPESEYKKAFTRHTKTAYANRYAVIGSHKKAKHGYFVDNNVAETLESVRQSALYADEHNNPSDNFDEEDALLIIRKVSEHHEAIQHAEWLNGRIGSKALFK